MRTSQHPGSVNVGVEHDLDVEGDVHRKGVDRNAGQPPAEHRLDVRPGDRGGGGGDEPWRSGLHELEAVAARSIIHGLHVVEHQRLFALAEHKQERRVHTPLRIGANTQPSFLSSIIPQLAHSCHAQRTGVAIEELAQDAWD